MRVLLLLSLGLAWTWTQTLADHAPSAAPGWISYRHAAVSQQSLQNVLVSIEERLRNLDAMYSPRYTPRWEMSLEQQARRLEAVESRLGRLETLIEIRLDKLSETLSARQLKEELSKDQISRKFDAAYERLNHRLGYLEDRFGHGIDKLQSSVEVTSERLERVEASQRTQHSNIEAGLMDLSSSVADVRRRMDDWNDTMTAMVAKEHHGTQHLQQISTSLEQLRGDINKTRAAAELNDAEDTTRLDDRHATNLGTKVTNMYNELWRRTQVLEGLAKDTMSLSNVTRRELQDGLRSLLVQLGRRGAFHTDREKQDATNSLEVTMDALAGLVQRRMSELSRKLDSSFQMLMLGQQMFLESCHRLQLDEPQIEAKLTQVLERILDTIHNRSMSTMQEVQVVHELLKSHHSHVVRTVGHTTNTVMKAAEEATKTSKQLQLAVLEVNDNIIAADKDSQSAIAKLTEYQATVHTKLTGILETMEDIQDQLAEGNPESKTSGENLESDSCKSNLNKITQISADFEKNYNSMLTLIEKRLYSDNCSINANSIAQNLVQELSKSNLLIPFNETMCVLNTNDSSNKKNLGVDYAFINDSNVYPTTEIPLLNKETISPSNTNTVETHFNISAVTVIHEKPETTRVASKVKEDNSSLSKSGSQNENNSNNLFPQYHISNNISEEEWNSVAAIISGSDYKNSDIIDTPTITVIHHERKESVENVNNSPALVLPESVQDEKDNENGQKTVNNTENALFVPFNEDTENLPGISNFTILGNISEGSHFNGSLSTIVTHGLQNNSSINLSETELNNMSDTIEDENIWSLREIKDMFPHKDLTGRSNFTWNVFKLDKNITKLEDIIRSQNNSDIDPNSIKPFENTQDQLEEMLQTIVDDYKTKPYSNITVQKFWNKLLQMRISREQINTIKIGDSKEQSHGDYENKKYEKDHSNEEKFNNDGDSKQTLATINKLMETTSQELSESHMMDQNLENRTVIVTSFNNNSSEKNISDKFHSIIET